MARFEWDDALSVHNEELDNQHRELMLIYNTLHESLLSDNHEETVKTKIATLEKLRRYVSYHFESEENFLEQIAFSELTDHRRQHQKFIDKIEALQRDVDQARISEYLSYKADAQLDC